LTRTCFPTIQTGNSYSPSDFSLVHPPNLNTLCPWI
jgi:hypothetical protein